MSEVESPASSGWIVRSKNSSVSQSGWSVGDQSACAFRCWRCVFPCFSNALDVWPAMRPAFATSLRRSVTSGIAHSRQCVLRASISLPQPRQSLRGCGARSARGIEGPPCASRFRLCVKRVAGPFSRLSFRLDHSCRATHSATGATARAHIGAVSDSFTAKAAMSRQFPFCSSKNHSRLSGSRVIQSSTHASTSGRIGSMRSQARLSRAGASL